jgi:haloalkane dehalogenase
MLIKSLIKIYVLVFGVFIYSGSVSAVENIDPYQYKLPRPTINADFPYESKYQQVLGYKMHYVEIGSGDPIVFVHGNPTSSYLWRNIINYTEPYGRSIAVDLIGMGKSDKPDIGYTFAEHYQFFEEFMNRMDLEDVTLVVHDWGGAIGFNYARLHPDKVKAIAFMEAALPPAFPKTCVANDSDPLCVFFADLKDPVLGYELIIKQNFFVEQVVPGFTNRSLGQQEMDYYRAPYLDEASRLPVWIWPLQIPINGSPADVVHTFSELKEFMIDSEMPKLLLYASPGAIFTPDVISWYRKNLENLEINYIGQGLHYVQEDQPDAIGLAITDWLRRLD